MLKRKPRPEYTADDIAKIQNHDKDWVESHQEDLAEIAKVAKSNGVQIVLDLDSKDKLAN
jgi:site-specific DNA-adenine methylase